MTERKSKVLRLTILVDNRGSEGLQAEHGWSVLIQAGERNILFDTGQGAALEPNAKALALDLASVDTLVLSHGHYDHSGGVAGIAESARDLQLFCHPSATVPRYSIKGGQPKAIGMPEDTMVALQGLPARSLHWTVSPAELAPGIGLSGPIPRLPEHEVPGGPYFLDALGKHQDAIGDELALCLETRRGLVLLLGCCHAGLANTLAQVRRHSASPRVHAIIGGLHLEGAGDDRIAKVVELLAKLKPDLIAPSHCSGDRATVLLQQALGDRVRPGAVGQSFEFETELL